MYEGITKLENSFSVEEINKSILSALVFGLADLKERGTYIFGAGKLGANVLTFLTSRQIKVLGFIDNNETLQGSLFCGHPVFSLSEVSQKAIVYIASATYMNPIFKELKKNGYHDTISHLQASILFYGDADFPSDMYLRDLTTDIFVNKDKYLALFSSLTEERSKQVLDNIIHFRLSLDVRFIDAAVSPYQSEYLEDEFIKVNATEVFYDVGGFDGDTAQKFIRYCDDGYLEIHIFEPDAKLVEKAKIRLKGHQGIFFNTLGVYDRQTTLFFDETGGLDGSISNAGKIEIETISIDRYCEDHALPTFIKFDVEGVEIEAITGASNTIASARPTLAIASYHYPKHLWEVPELVLSMNKNYTLYVRHYTDSIFDTIIYFV